MPARRIQFQHDETWSDEAEFRHDSGWTNEAQRMLDRWNRATDAANHHNQGEQVMAHQPA